MLASQYWHIGLSVKFHIGATLIAMIYYPWINIFRNDNDAPELILLSTMTVIA